jgi:hypothetical protein
MVPRRDCDGDETDIPQIAAGFSVILLLFRSPSVCVFSVGAVSLLFLTSISSATCVAGPWRLPWVNPGVATFLFATVAVSCHDDDRMCGQSAAGRRRKSTF